MKSVALKKGLILVTLLCSIGSYATAQIDETDGVMIALENYMTGSSYNHPDKLIAAFYPEADMFLDHPDQPIFLVNPEKYAGFFKDREAGVFNGRYAKLLSLDIEGNVAIAKAEILIPKNESLYIDYFMLKKLEDGWKIIGKVAGRADSTRSGEKMLLIATDKGNGEDFSDLISDYEAATSKGYTVNIVSPKGGAIIFNGLNMGNPKHRDYIYNADFMYALENTLAASDVKSADYVAAHYVCDKDAKKAKSGDVEIDRLYSDICRTDKPCGN